MDLRWVDWGGLRAWSSFSLVGFWSVGFVSGGGWVDGGRVGGFYMYCCSDCLVA